MIAASYGLKQSISYYRELTKTDKSGTNLYGLVDGAKQIGLEASALSGTQDELLESIKSGEIKFPLIAHVVSSEAMLHFIVVFGIKRGRVSIGDPGRGKYQLTLEKFFQRWTGYIVTFQKTGEFQAGNYTRGSFLKFFSLLKEQYCKLVGILLLSLIIAGIGIVGAFVFEVVIDNFALDTGYYEDAEEHDQGNTISEGDNIETDDGEGSHDHEGESALDRFLETIFDLASLSGFHTVFIAMILLYLLQAGIQFVRGYLIATMSKTIDIRLSLSYYNHLTDLPVSSIAMRQTGEYLSRFADTATIRLAISGATITLLVDSLMVIACGVILYMQNSRLFLVSFLMIFFYAVIVIAYRKPVERSNRQVMEDNARLQSYFKESIDGMETVKAACAEEQVKGATTSRFTRFVNSVFKNSLISMSQDTLADTVELIGTVVILWIGFTLVLLGQVTIGALMTFYVLLAYFTSPIKNLIELQPTIQTALVAADRLNDILDLQCEGTGGEKELHNVERWEIKNVNFRYGNRPLLLKNVNLTVNRGEKIAIVGESGSGKTTLAKLILRFYSPESGQILINGQNINVIDLSVLRGQIAYVDQNTFLFSDTVKNNLKLGCMEATDGEIFQACKVSHAAEFIEALPMGYDTPLDENGTNLSGGQRQRLAIARALLKKPQLLILDEATSNLDTVTETGIKNTIFGFDKNLTCIIIAHRLTTIKNCDRIYVMEGGEIVECGTHEALIQKGGKYAALWDAQ